MESWIMRQVQVIHQEQHLLTLAFSKRVQGTPQASQLVTELVSRLGYFPVRLGNIIHAHLCPQVIED